MRHAALVLCLLACLPLGARAAASVELDRIVAVVNDQVIVESELESRMRTVRAQLRQSGTPAPPRNVLRRQVLERLILDKLQLQMARNLGVQVDDNTLNQAVARLAEQNGMTLRRFRDIIERDGFDFAQFRENIRNELTIRRLQQRRINDRVKVTQREIENYLATKANQSNPHREYRLSHILISVPEAASADEIDAARAEAEDVLARLRAGADFAQTAVAVSDAQQALEGGDLGWRKRQELPTLFAPLIQDMAPGEVSDIVRSPSGFHIVKLVNVRGEDRVMVTQIRARHILIRTDELTSDGDARRQLEQLKRRLENGADFAELARAHSDDRSSAIDGGDLGWLSPGDAVPRFEQTISRLPPGRISEPFRTQFGWHIAEVVDRRRHDSTEDVRRARAVEQIRQRKAEQELQNWLRRLRDEAYVELRLRE